MTKALTASIIGVLCCTTIPASAQQGRAKLDAPGKVAFGSTYQAAAATLGKDAEPHEIDPPEPGMKALLCNDCALLPNVEGFTMYFHDKKGLVRLEAFAIAGMFKSVDECQKADGDMLPKLVGLYGKPDSNSNGKKGSASVRTALFKFADGGSIEHVSNISGAERPCAYTVVYKSKSASR
jgi:hypothetical protein